MDQLPGAIVGGLAVIGIMWLWREIVPRIMTHLLQGEPKIAGTWKTTFKEAGETKHETVELFQKGRLIKGTLVLREADGESKYRFRGTFKHRILKAVYESTDPTEYECGAFAMIYRMGKMDGQYILFGTDSEDLVTSEYTWEHKR